MTYEPACLPACLPTYLPPYLPTYLPAYLPTSLPAYLPTCMHACMHISYLQAMYTGSTRMWLDYLPRDALLSKAQSFFAAPAAGCPSTPGIMIYGSCSSVHLHVQFLLTVMPVCLRCAYNYSCSFVCVYIYIYIERERDCMYYHVPIVGGSQVLSP